MVAAEAVDVLALVLLESLAKLADDLLAFLVVGQVLGSRLVAKIDGGVPIKRGSPVGGSELRLRNGSWLSLARKSLGTEAGEILLLADITESRRTAEMLQRSERLV